jgi:small subunit ribosomal protein S8
MLDPIAEMLTRIRNAQRAGKPDVSISLSKIKLAVANILLKEGFVESVEIDKKGNFEKIQIGLKYHQVSNTRKIPAIKDLRRISKEGQRVYVKKTDVKKVKSDYGIAIISTSKGMMTGADAKKNGLGGEYICEVW